MPKFSEKSRLKLSTCDPELRKLFNEVIKHVDCTIIEGHRNKDRQNKLFQEGHTQVKYPNSNHNSMPSRAVDVVPYPIDWDNINRFHHFAGIVKGIASQMGLKIKWGGEFKGFFDGPHYEVRK